VSLRNKLALLFLAITAASFGAIYFIVVPQLQSKLEDQQLEDLSLIAAASAERLEDLLERGDVTAEDLDSTVRAVADSADARVTLLDIQRQSGRLEFPVFTDSREQLLVPENPELALGAVRGEAVATGSRRFEGEKLGQLAQPLYFHGRPERVALYSKSFEDVQESVALVRNRLLVATGIALVIALVGGYLVAQALARRVRRLERGAEQVARGRFIDPLPVDSEDELGQLTRTFNDMQEQLRQLDRARKDFIATASHELRTPIFSLGGFVELLQDEDLDDETRREFLETMTEQVDRLQKLSVDLLDLSRIDSGSIELNQERVDLSELARTIVGEFTPAVTAHGTELKVHLPTDEVSARCDRERVAQIMRILLDNALRHTPDGTRVTVSAEHNNGAAEFTVADSGPGLGDGASSRVFQPFHTGDAARGAGLGLAIAKELAERMDGRIVLLSRPGKTVFTLELPVAG
jgi:two-component system, OmpR family, sensor kinase